MIKFFRVLSPGHREHGLNCVDSSIEVSSRI